MGGSGWVQVGGVPRFENDYFSKILKKTKNTWSGRGGAPGLAACHARGKNCGWVGGLGGLAACHAQNKTTAYCDYQLLVSIVIVQC